MSDMFKLPASSYDEIVKIIQAYANEKEGTMLSLDDITHSSGVPRTVVSGNNGFLVQVGLTTEGNKKSATETGRMLGRAYIHKISEDVCRIWKDIFSEVDFLNRMISAVRIRNGMDRSSFLNHIVYSSGQKDTKQCRAGAGAIIEIMKVIGLLVESDGKLTVCELDERTTDAEAYKDASPKEKGEVVIKDDKIIYSAKSGVVNINVNINCSVDEIDALTEKLKKLMSEI